MRKYPASSFALSLFLLGLFFFAKADHSQRDHRNHAAHASSMHDGGRHHANHHMNDHGLKHSQGHEHSEHAMHREETLPSSEAVLVSCDDHTRWCKISENVEFRFSEHPVVARVFEIELRGKSVSKAKAYFNMEVMDMGTRQFDLRPTASNVFTRKLVLPFCPTGDTAWFLELDIDSKKYLYNFDVLIQKG